MTSRIATGNARKAQAADKKRQEEDDRLEAEESAKWSQGSKKGNAKREADVDKKAEAARKKAERDALLKAEEDSLPSKPSNSKRGQEKIAARRAGKIDDFITPSSAPSLSASGIDNALDLLSLTNEKSVGTGNSKADGIDRHPERRFKAAYAAFEESRLPQLKEEHPGLRQNQMKELIRKEFEKSPLNPFNQATVAYNASKDDVHTKRKELRDATEKRLTSK
ncbi:hypothetical protein D0Z03_001932 [Geotrichum reessii]|nr:hypothetical protein D0Z03_001932 [Galactomyces reessii]